MKIDPKTLEDVLKTMPPIKDKIGGVERALRFLVVELNKGDNNSIITISNIVAERLQKYVGIDKYREAVNFYTELFFGIMNKYDRESRETLGDYR